VRRKLSSAHSPRNGLWTRRCYQQAYYAPTSHARPFRHLSDCCLHYYNVGLPCVAVVRVKLAGSVNPAQGRLEVKYRDYWGTVCDDDEFDDTAAKVACYMLGFGYDFIVA